MIEKLNSIQDIIRKMLLNFTTIQKKMLEKH
jgi:hypothetical protein